MLLFLNNNCLLNTTFEYLALVFGGYNKTTNAGAGNIKGNTTIRMSIYGNINKKASKLRHAMASQGKQGKPGKAKQSQA